MRFVNFYPPYLGAGIRVMFIAPDWSTIKVRLALNWLNRNLFGTQFGGSLYAMCDPFFVIILMRQLGADYTVWDRAACIQFLRPGRGPVTTTFHIPTERVEEIRALADRGEKVEPVFQAEVVDETGQVVRGPVSKARAQQLLAILRPAFPTYRLVREAEAPR